MTQQLERSYFDHQLQEIAGLDEVMVRKVISFGAVRPFQSGGGRGKVRMWLESEVALLAAVAAVHRARFSLPLAHTITAAIGFYSNLNATDRADMVIEVVDGQWLFTRPTLRAARTDFVGRIDRSERQEVLVTGLDLVNQAISDPTVRFQGIHPSSYCSTGRALAAVWSEDPGEVAARAARKEPGSMLEINLSFEIRRTIENLRAATDV